MILRFAVAAAVHARADDLVSVFFLSGSPQPRGGEPQSIWRALTAPRNAAANSPFLFNETARAWFMTDAHATGPQVRAPGQALLYSQAPSTALPVAHVVRGRVVETAVVQDMAFNHIDTVLVVDVLGERDVLPGEPWMPTPL